MNDSLGRILRTALQVIAGGGLFAVVELVAADLQSPYLLPLYVFGITVLQNALEEAGHGAILREPKPAPSPLHEDDPHTFT